MDFSQLMPVVNGIVGIAAAIGLVSLHPKAPKAPAQPPKADAGGVLPVPVPAPGPAPTLPVKTIHAIIVMLSIVMGILTASQTPGGLAALDWPTLIKAFAEAAFTVFAASQLMYEHVIKPYLKKGAN